MIKVIDPTEYNFMDALKAMNEGAVIWRNSWIPNNFCFLNKEHVSKMPFINELLKIDTVIHFESFVSMVRSYSEDYTEVITGYTFTNEDRAALDWRICEIEDE